MSRFIQEGVAAATRAAITIGRGPGNDITINDPHLSRTHCRVVWGDGAVMVEDLGSTNGTVVNGHPVIRRKILRNGDVVKVGRHRFIFRGDALLSC